MKSKDGNNLHERLLARFNFSDIELAKAFSINNASITQSLINRWPDMDGKERTGEVESWFLLIEKHLREFAKKNNLRLTKQLKSLFTMETLKNAASLFVYTSNIKDENKLVAYKNRLFTRVEKIASILNDKFKNKINVELPALLAASDCVPIWGQHGAHFK